MDASAAAPSAIALLGPTGAGKSALAMSLAGLMPVEIISVDSAQVYRGMDIGTAKPSAQERAAVPHHLLDIRDPESVYSAGEFLRDCQALIRDIRARGAVPLLVGGTMLYFRALFRGIAALPKADPALRAALDARAAVQGWPALHAELAQVDPAAAARIHENDAQRIQRALEVHGLSGRSLSHWWKSEPSLLQTVSAGHLILVLEPATRAVLHARIEARLDAMLSAGFVEEVRRLYARGTLSADSPAIRAVGYRQLWDFCDGRLTLAECRLNALAATRQLAKRQLTWLRGSGLFPQGSEPLRFDPLAADSTERIAAAVLKWCSSSTPAQS